MTERRSKLAILQSIKDYFDTVGYHKPFYKSDLKDEGIDPATAEDFLKIIMFCQRELPFIELTDFGKRFILKENSNQKYLDLNEFLQLKEELTEKKVHLNSVSPENKSVRTNIYNSEPLLAMKFTCQECDFSISYPNHCDEQMEFNSVTNHLECYFCKLVQPVPIHHNKEMKLMISNQREK